MLKPDPICDTICPWCGAVNTSRLHMDIRTVLGFLVLGFLFCPLEPTLKCTQCGNLHRKGKGIRH